VELKSFGYFWMVRKLTPPNSLIDFSSNDYLGLARSEALAVRFASLTTAIHGSTGSRLLTGNHHISMEVEAFLADLWQVDSCLIFNSGYMANLGVLSALGTRHATILYDQLAHACIKDGARLSQAARFSFQHNDLSHLESRLRKSKGATYVIVESIYSMDGDVAPLEEMCDICETHGAHLIVDEAHATAVEGAHGGGLSEALGITNRLYARINTFGKGLGLHGASVSGSRKLKDHLINHSRPFIYTTAPPPRLFAEIRCAFLYLQEHIELQDDLRARVADFRNYWTGIEPPFTLLPASHAIQAVIQPGASEVRRVSERLQSAGFDVRPILPPTVQAGSERLRICLHSFNSNEEIRSLVDSIAQVEINRDY
jgi:8-amino-7-oxononanoate synthase